MLLYRIAKQNFINDFSGKGAELYGGRWNLKGFPAVYTVEYIFRGVDAELIRRNER